MGRRSTSQTAKDRYAQALKAINEKCRRTRHEPLSDQHRQLNQTLKAHFVTPTGKFNVHNTVGDVY